MEKWIEELKVGDNVLRSTSFRGYSLMKVKRITKTQIILWDGSNGSAEYKHNKRYGRSIGTSTWSTCYIQEVTGERLMEIKKEESIRNAKYYVSKIVVPNDMEEAQKIIEFAKKYQPNEV